MELITIIAIFVSLYMAFTISANDIGNSVGTVVGSGAINIKRALVLNSIFAFLGAIFLSKAVTETIGKGIIPAGMLDIKGASIITFTTGLWITFTLWKKIPISGSEAIIGAVTGFGVASIGIDKLNLQTLWVIMLSWIVSPLIGLVTGYLTYRALNTVIFTKTTMKKRSRIEKIFKYLLILTSCATALSIGAIDISIATSVLYITFGQAGLEIKIIGAIMLIVGILIAGNRVSDTIGRRITELVPSRSFSAQISAAIIYALFVYNGIPISPTQTLVGSIIGVGLAYGVSSVKIDVVKDVIHIWLLTIPCCFTLAMVLKTISTLLM